MKKLYSDFDRFEMKQRRRHKKFVDARFKELRRKERLLRHSPVRPLNS